MMLEHALHYAAKGWPIFQCQPMSKKPMRVGWQDEATTNADTIRAWWTDKPDANIGLLCGSKSGIAVIDVDVSEKGNGFRELEALDIEEWETHYQQTPRGGRHFFFATQHPVKNAVGFFGKGSCVDVRGDGGYVLLAPSVTERGTYTIEEADLAQFPEAFMIREQRTDQLDFSEVSYGDTHVPLVAIECETRRAEAIQFLYAHEPAIHGQSGHATLLKVARELVWGYLVKADEAIDLMWEYFNPKCVPPWDRQDKAQAKDFERKVFEVFKFPPLQIAGYRLSVVKQELSAVAAALARGQSAFGPVLPPEPPEESDMEGFTPTVIPKVEVVKANKNTDPIATIYRDYQEGLDKYELCVPPGIVGELARFITDTAGKPQPFLSLGAAITAQAAMMGRLYCDEDDTRSNMYCIGVAPSSAGKDHPTKMIDRLFVQAGAEAMVGGSDLTSDTSLVNSIKGMAYPSGYIMIWDECGHIISNLRNGANGAASATVVPALMKLYSCSGDMYRAKMKVSEPMVTINQPHVCLWGVTTHASLFDGLTTASLRDGFLGRVLPFVSELDPVYIGGRGAKFPPHIIQHFAKMYERTKVAADISGLPKMTVIQETESARKKRNTFARKCEEIKSKLANDQAYLWGKAHENCRKIALAIAGGMEKPVITYEIMDYSIQLTRLILVEYQKQVDHHMFDGAYEREIKTIYQKALRKFGTRPFTRSDLCRITQYIDPKNRNTYRDDFLDLSNEYVMVAGEGKYQLLKIGTYAAIGEK